MCLVLQEISVQVKYWSHANLTKKQVKEVLFIKVRQMSRQNAFYQDLMLKLDKSYNLSISTKSEFLELIFGPSWHVCEGFLFSQL